METLSYNIFVKTVLKFFFNTSQTLINIV